jgi:hypothetical protein
MIDGMTFFLEALRNVGGRVGIILEQQDSHFHAPIRGLTAWSSAGESRSNVQYTTTSGNWCKGPWRPFFVAAIMARA